ncbi:MAG TPA: hypothetical protein P5140_08695 [Methanofastidiosum sp.]|nr:hypothetical protein [Methanofastidiosum sp.]
MGSLEATTTRTVYVKDTIYRVTEPSSALFGCLIFCSQEYSVAQSGPVQWQIAKLEDAEYGEISFMPNIISPHFVLLLLADDFAAITDPVDTSFVPFSQTEATASMVSIPDDELNTILTDVGVPFIKIDELEYSYTEILELMVRPALEEYFKWFPKVVIQTYPMTTSNTVEIPFIKDAYDVLHVSLNQGLVGGTSNVLLRYFDEVVWTAQSPVMGHVGGRKAPHTVVQDYGAMMLDRAVRQGILNYGTRIHFDVYKAANRTKVLRVYSNKQGALQVHFALRTLNWDDTEFARRPELRELIRSYVLRAFGAIRSQLKSDIPGVGDYALWLTKAEELRTKVLEEWKELAKYSGILRGSA